MYKALIGALLTTTVLAGCAATDESANPYSSVTEAEYNEIKQKTELTKADFIKIRVYEAGVRCRLETPTGSKISERKCTTRAQREAYKDAADEYVRQAIKNDGYVRETVK
jgi:hypothetical protein